MASLEVKSLLIGISFLIFFGCNFVVPELDEKDADDAPSNPKQVTSDMKTLTQQTMGECPEI